MNIESIKGAYAHPLPARWNGPIAWLLRRPEAAALVPDGAAGDVPVSPSGPLRRRNLRHFTPREMSELSLDLYVGGLLGYEDYAMLTFQPELHPDYDATIGALTGVKAQPDRPRDFIELWEDRLQFELAHAPENHLLIARIQHIVDLLHKVATHPEQVG